MLLDYRTHVWATGTSCLFIFFASKTVLGNSLVLIGPRDPTTRTTVKRTYVFCDHRACISSRIEESARTLVALDVDG